MHTNKTNTAIKMLDANIKKAKALLDNMNQLSDDLDKIIYVTPANRRKQLRRK